MTPKQAILIILTVILCVAAINLRDHASDNYRTQITILDKALQSGEIDRSLYNTLEQFLFDFAQEGSLSSDFDILQYYYRECTSDPYGFNSD